MMNDECGMMNVRQRHSRSEEHTSELQSRSDLVCRLLLEKKKKKDARQISPQEHTTELQTASHILCSYVSEGTNDTRRDTADYDRTHHHLHQNLYRACSAH